MAILPITMGEKIFLLNKSFLKFLKALSLGEEKEKSWIGEICCSRMKSETCTAKRSQATQKWYFIEIKI